MNLKELIEKINKYENIERFIENINGDFNIDIEKVDIRKEEVTEENSYSYEEAPLLYIEKIAGLDRVSEVEMKKAIEDLDENMENIINGMLRDIVKIAFKYYVKGIDLLDLVQEGSIGVIEGVEFYKKSYGDIYNYLKVCAIYKMIKYIEIQFEYQKNEYRLLLEKEKENKKEEEEEYKLLIRELELLDKTTILELPKKMSYIEEEFLLKFYGIVGERRFSIYELEDENSIEHGTGEIIFNDAVRKIGLVGGKIISNS